MIISKKNLEKLIQERIAQEVSRREYERYIDDRFVHVHERINALEEKINPNWRIEESIRPAGDL